ncbi:LysR family transcriptional regulator [Acetobacter sp. TBRC 12305]|uniref:LysR family transcriptional regulator n=1 Tax=Acetobacter garciniae TaxID=2817435 RepID=A0A939HQJ0_9PROT|nr:LysR family transcriptional regulator [Acetobacter garciniae]MBO1326579.1 LysR family transcriptional regulator [Acetobacter garciniae]MBX0346238.1 LysR family transcriptional regulator [Acetobacter garciniae]
MQVNRLTIRHLRLVAAILREGNLVRAAASLNMTQSAVTKALHETEQSLQMVLFSRTNRGTVPTPAGEMLGVHARLILSQLDSAAQELTDLHDGTGGRIAIGTLIAASGLLLPNAILALQRLRPRLVIKVVEGTNDVLLPALRCGELDMVIGRQPEFGLRDGFVHEFLLHDVARIVVRATHPLVGARHVTLADLLEWPWIMPGYETTLRRQIEATLRTASLDLPRRYVESVSFLINRALLLEDDYIGVWPSSVARVETDMGFIQVLKVDLPATSHPIGVTLNPAVRMRPAAQIFLDTLRDEAQKSQIM